MSNAEKDTYGSNINGDFKRPILPEKVADVGRFDITVDPESTIHGGVMCRNLEIKGTPFEIKGSVMALGSIKVQVDADSGGVLGPLVAGNNILASRNSGAGTFRVSGDLSSTRVNLNGAFVYGNIFGTNVILNDCVVLGSIHASQHLEMSNVACFTFVAEDVSIKQSAYLLNYAATATGKLDLDGNIYVVCNMPWKDGIDPAAKSTLRISSQDVRMIEANRKEGGVDQVNIISLFDRVIDLSPSQKQLDKNTAWVEKSVINLSDQGFDPDKCKRFESHFFDFFR